jgi:hypothetical protein
MINDLEGQPVLEEREITGRRLKVPWIPGIEPPRSNTTKNCIRKSIGLAFL